MTAGLLLRFPKQILTPAGAGALSDSAQASPPLFPSAAIYSSWTNGLQFLKKREATKVKMKGCTVHIKKGEKISQVV